MITSTLKLRLILILSLSLSPFIIICQIPDINYKKQIKTFDLKEIPKLTKIKLSDLGFKDIEYIPLETNENCIIGPDDVFLPIKIIAGEDYYLINRFTSILKFQSNGSFKAKIGDKGRGPEEFTVVHDLDINSVGHNIYVVSAWQKKFNVYSETGAFMRSFHMPLYAPIDFRLVDGKILCYCENHMGNIENSYTLMDTTGRVSKSFPNRYPFKNHDGFSIYRENTFYRFNNKLFKKEVYSDTIYLYENMAFKPHLVIEVGKKLITPEVRSTNDGMDIGKKYILPLKLFEFGDYIYYEFSYKVEIPDNVLIYSFIGSKKNNYQAVFNMSDGIINDLDGGPNILPRTIKDDNTIIAIIDALELKSYISSEAFKKSTPKYPDKKKNLGKLANNLKETDNPVLILVKVKN